MLVFPLAALPTCAPVAFSRVGVLEVPVGVVELSVEAFAVLVGVSVVVVGVSVVVDVPVVVGDVSVVPVDAPAVVVDVCFVVAVGVFSPVLLVVGSVGFEDPSFDSGVFTSSAYLPTPGRSVGSLFLTDETTT